MEKINELLNIKVAIVHDTLIHFGGAERVLIKLIEIFPKADVFTSLASKNMIRLIKEKSFGKLTFSKLSRYQLVIKKSSLFKPYFFHYYWQSLNLNDYDLVISSSHSFCSNFVQVNNTHISYIHTPPKFLYKEFNEMGWLKKPFFNKMFWPYFYLLKKKIKKNNKKINLLIVNSKEVQKRIKNYYQTNSLLIYPPVNFFKTIDQKKNNKDKYLFFSRLVKQKGIELVIKTFNKNMKPLLIVGTSDQEKKWQQMAKNNIVFHGFIEDEKIAEIYSQSKALIYASIDEDFGIIPIEAMSCGLPVICYRSGGVTESVINKKTGLYFEEYTEESLNKAINDFEKITFKAEDCINRAKYFSEAKFEKSILKACKKQLQLKNNY